MRSNVLRQRLEKKIVRRARNPLEASMPMTPEAAAALQAHSQENKGRLPDGQVETGIPCAQRLRNLSSPNAERKSQWRMMGMIFRTQAQLECEVLFFDGTVTKITRPCHMLMEEQSSSKHGEVL